MTHNKYFLIIALSVLISHTSSVKAQVGINTTNPQSTLDIVAINTTDHPAGMIAPRLTLAELTLKGDGLYGINQIGAIIYISNISGGNTLSQRSSINSPGYYYFNGGAWQKLSSTTAVSFNAGDVMQSLEQTDHDGWYLLNGRSVYTLSTTARQAAVKLGFSSYLPNATDRMLKGKTAGETMSALGGSNTLSILQKHLPNAAIIPTASLTLQSADSHSHTISGYTDSGGIHSHYISSGMLSSGGSHNHLVSATLNSMGDHNHTINGTLNTAGLHSHTGKWIFYVPTNDVDRGNKAGSLWDMLSAVTTRNSSAGNHNHTVSSTLNSTNAHTHTVNGTLQSADSHSHTVTNASLAAADSHYHSLSGSLDYYGTTHTHGVNTTFLVRTDGQSKTIDNRSEYLVVNTFIYLGK
ncbi:MAG: hypothetical protein QM653_17300 [Dysgonomonas sp.]|uniref:hypothetical protein n=1 Tax=Dysgonomonas sp. TaxID=1891233 RepID=UPI0039E3FAB4